MLKFRQMANFKWVKRPIFVLAILAGIVLITSASWGCAQQRYTGQVETLNFGDLSVDSNEFIYIAQQHGYFAENGIDFVTRNFDTGPAALDSLVKGDINLTATGEFPFVVKAFAKEKISIIGITDKFSSLYLVARKDRGIQNISDLKGKNVGVVKNALPEFYLGQLLELQGLSIKDINEVNVNPPQWVTAIVSGNVDAIAVSQPYLKDLQTQLGDKFISWPAQTNQPAFGVLVCRNEWLSQHSSQAKRLSTALVQAERFLINHPEAARNILVQHFNYDAAYAAALWPNHQFALSLDQSLILTMEDEARWMMANNLTNEKTVPNFLNYIDENGLKAVKPEAVKIIR